MAERGSRLAYLRGNGLPIQETHNERMLRMLSVQHPPEPSRLPEADFAMSQLRQLFNGTDQEL